MTAIGAVSNSGYAHDMRKPIGPRTARHAPAARPHRRALAAKPQRTYPNRIAEILHERGQTYAELGDAVDAHEITIAKLATGKQQLTFDWMKRLAAALGVAPQDIIAKPADSNLRRVRVRGALKAGDWAESHEWPDDDQYDVMVPDESSLRGLHLYGGEIAGESMNQRYPNRSVVVLSRIGQRPGEIAVGKRYHVRLTRPDGQTEETVKTLVKDDEGRFWLKPESSHPEHQEWIPLDGKPGVVVELVGRVRFVVQREE